ncbi:MAG: RHS repeat-associated core domain-containing protein [Terrimicrobiaceae bacterium]|nr:RHS repeat-associated core domain-containing protein [Terrimicrobiaceae bacterium]
MRTIQAALAAILVSAVQPAVAEVLHIKGVPVPPIQTVEQARAETDKRLAAIQAREAAEAKVAAQVTSSASAITHSPLFFTGKPLVEETDQYAFLFRHYDPELNRWTTSDPSGFPDWPNNYLYSNTPLNGVDPDGLAWNELDYVWHFVAGGGSAVSLSEIGHLDGIRNLARSAGGVIEDFAARIESYASDMIKPYTGSFQLSLQQRFDNYSSVSYPIGRAGISGYFHGTMTSTPFSTGPGGTYS